MQTGRLLSLAILLSLASSLLLPACASNPNAKLDGGLNQLIQAEKRGEAESFARRSGGSIELVDGNVRVSILCVAGQTETAAKVIAAVGTVEIVITDYNNIQALVPITSLIALADDKSIRYIQLPIRPTLP